MKNKKNLISAILLCVGLLLAVCSIFCFFGDALKMSVEVEPGVIYTGTLNSVFIFIFGGDVTLNSNFPGEESTSLPVKMTPTLLVVFIFIIIISLIVVIILVGLFSKKLKSNFILVLVCAVSVLTLINAILALTSKDALITAYGADPAHVEDYSAISLGNGVISFLILNFVSFIVDVASIVISINWNLKSHH